VYEISDKKNQTVTDFSKLISHERAKKFRSAKTFWREKKEVLGVSYNRYAVIENGTVKSSLELAVKIIAALEIDECTAIHAFVRDIMPTKQLKAHFTDLHSSKNISNRAISITEDQSKLFKSSPIANEIAGYISINSDRGVSVQEICESFSMKKESVKEILHKLLFADFIKKKNKTLYQVPDGAWINIPDLSEFRESRLQHFASAVDSHFSTDYHENITIEQSTFRVLSKRQVNMLRSRARRLARWLSALPDEKGEAYRFFCGGNICKFGNNKGNFVPKDRLIIEDN